MNPQQRVYGVDFAAAKRSAGESLWVAECRVDPAADDDEETGDRLVVESLLPAADRFDGEPTGRAETLDALVEFINGAETPAVFGLDFPFGVGRRLVDADDWTEVVAGFPGTLAVDVDLEDIDTRPSKAFYDAVKREYGTGVSERATDSGALSPVDWRMKELTYYGIRDVLSDLAADDTVTVAPMQGTGGERVVVETYPSRVFGELPAVDANTEGYRGERDAAFARRVENAEALEHAGVGFGTPTDETDPRLKACATDDALDAVAAAFGALSACRTDFDAGEDGAAFGHIYA